MRLLTGSLLCLAAACARPEAGPRPAPELAPTGAPPPSAAVVGDVAATPELAFHGLLAAMTANDLPGVQRLTTEKGLASLDAGRAGSPRSEVFPRWGKAWAGWAVRWKERDGAHARARLGPEVKEHGLDFVKTDQGWKLDRWSPGE